jgi:hypothetical protein
MLSPTISYGFNLKDAHMFYYSADGTMNFSNENEERIEISGINEEQMFICARNALCCRDNILKELNGKSYQLEAAREMIEALEGFIDAYKKEEDAE